MTPASSERREQFADAVLRIIARAGCGAVSVRTVAAEAGWSAGALQKTFPTKEALLRAAVELLIARAEAQEDEEITATTVPDYLIAHLELSLPLDASRRTDTILWNAITTEAAHTPWMAEILRAQDDAVFDGLQDSLAALGNDDPAGTARALLALSDGLATQMLYAPERSAEIRAALRTAVPLLLA